MPSQTPVPYADLRAKFAIDATTCIADAVRHLAEKRLTFVCVVDPDQDDRVVGMLSERDCLKWIVRADSSAFFSGRDATMEPVTRIMSAAERMLSLRHDTTVFTALSMVQHKIWRHLPVLDDRERLAGVLDIRKLLLELDGGRTDDKGMGAVARGKGRHLSSVWHGKCVADLLRTKRKEKIVEGTSLELYLRTRAAAHTVSSEISAEEAAQQMTRERLTFLIVLEPIASARETIGDIIPRPSPYERNRVAGLVNERDFVKFAGTDGGCSVTSFSSTPVRALMTPLDKVMRVSLTESVSSCVDKLFKYNARHIPVIDQEHLFGVVSLRDVLRPLLPERGTGDHVLAGAEHARTSSVWRRT